MSGWEPRANHSLGLGLFFGASKWKPMGRDWREARTVSEAIGTWRFFLTRVET